MKFLLLLVFLTSVVFVSSQNTYTLQWNSGSSAYTLNIQANDSVTFTTNDNIGHTVTHVPSSGTALFDQTIKGTNETPGTFTYQFTTDGVYSVADSNDANLKATITVGNSTSSTTTTTTGSSEPASTSTTGSSDPVSTSNSTAAATTGEATTDAVTTTGTPNNQLSTTGDSSKEHSTTGAASSLVNNQIISLMVVLISLVAVLL